MDFEKIYRDFEAARIKYDLEKMSNIIVQAIDFRAELIQAGKANELPPSVNYIIGHIGILAYHTMKLLSDGKGDKAMTNLLAFNKFSNQAFNLFFYLNYLLGRALYLTGDYLTAAKIFSNYEALREANLGDVDELSLFYRANCLALLGDFNAAARLYEKILTIKANFSEAKKNLELVLRGSNKNISREVKSLWKFSSWKDVPIFINARDRLGVMKKLIDWLLAAGYRNLIILDNNSTYPPLLEYYNKLKEHRGGACKNCYARKKSRLQSSVVVKYFGGVKNFDAVHLHRPRCYSD